MLPAVSDSAVATVRPRSVTTAFNCLRKLTEVLIGRQGGRGSLLIESHFRRQCSVRRGRVQASLRQTFSRKTSDPDRRPSAPDSGSTPERVDDQILMSACPHPSRLPFDGQDQHRCRWTRIQPTRWLFARQRVMQYVRQGFRPRASPCTRDRSRVHQLLPCSARRSSRTPGRRTHSRIPCAPRKAVQPGQPRLVQQERFCLRLPPRSSRRRRMIQKDDQPGRLQARSNPYRESLGLPERTEVLRTHDRRIHCSWLSPSSSCSSPP